MPALHPYGIRLTCSSSIFLTSTLKLRIHERRDTPQTYSIKLRSLADDRIDPIG